MYHVKKNNWDVNEKEQMELVNSKSQLRLFKIYCNSVLQYLSLLKILSTASRSRFSSVGRASDSQIFWEHEFESRQPHLCNSVWGQDWWPACRQEVGMCSTRGGSQGMYIMFTSAMWIRQPTLALKPRGDVTRNPKRGYQWPQKRTHVSAQKLLKKIWVREIQLPQLKARV